MVSSSAALALLYSSGVSVPCWRSTSNWKSSSFIASSSNALRSRAGAVGSTKSVKAAAASASRPRLCRIQGRLRTIGARHDVEAAHQQHQHESAEDVDAVLVQGIGSINRRAQPTSGAIVVGRCLRSTAGHCAATGIRGLTTLRGFRRKIASAADAEAEVFTGFHVGRDHDVGLRVLHLTGRLRVFRFEGHTLGRHDDEVLHVAQRLGSKTGFAGVRHVEGNLKLRFAWAQRIGQEIMILLRSGSCFGGDRLTAGGAGLGRF